ncbi:MAG: DUF86 domain-containing protein [Acidimicrobiia bacterium]|nr:DUF86 domain-containing protein [Acidimicrobiia bacterium]
MSTEHRGNTHRLSPSLLDRNKDIPSAQIVGLRNVLAHKYGDIDHSILWYIGYRRCA